MITKKYLYKGRTLFVKQYEAVNNTSFATFFVDKKGQKRAYITDGLSLGHSSADKAQYELDMFAAKHGLEEA